jgi:predicted DNA-binding transcriptional regulator AlpA
MSKVLLRLLRYRHLKERHVVENWAQLQRLIKQQGFPAGRLLGPNTRVWTEDEVVDWVSTRPVTRDEFAA